MKFTGCVLAVLLITGAGLSNADERDGYITLPDAEQREPVSFRFRTNADSEDETVEVTMMFNDQPYVFSDLEFDGDTMTFSLDTGTVYQCTLVMGKKTRSYSGDCSGLENAERILSITILSPSQD